MKTMMKMAGGATLLAMAVAANTAVADPVDPLFFSQNAGWVSPINSFDTSVGNQFQGFSDPTDQTGDGAPAGTFGTMSWSGIPNEPVSSINITGHVNADSPVRLESDFATDDVDGEWNQGDWWAITTLLQTNNALSVSTGGTGVVPNPLWEADTLANLYIYTDEAETNKIFEDLNSLVTVEFWETYNLFDGCPASPNPLVTQCDDIYRVTEADFDPVAFAYEGYVYSIDFALAPGPSTDDEGNIVGTTLVCSGAFLAEECEGLGVPEDEIWVFTPEFNPGTSSIYVLAQWTATRIPEPSVLGLFGIGIMGLGLAGRRRKQAKA